MNYIMSIFAVICSFSLVYSMEECDANPHICEANQHIKEYVYFCTKFDLIGTPQTQQQCIFLKTAVAFIECINCEEPNKWILLNQLFGKKTSKENTSLQKYISTIDELETVMARTVYSLAKKKLTCLPREIEYLTHIIELDLSDNYLQTLPKQVDSLIRLQKLNLSNNPISTIPACVCSLPQLTTLYADNIGLTKLPAEISNLTSLRILSIKQNNLTNPPDILIKLVNLELLDCSDNEITIPIAQWITAIPRLQQINIEGNFFCPIENSASNKTQLYPIAKTSTMRIKR